MATQHLQVGELIGGNYRIERALSEGGMGAVYIAEQLSTRKSRALKVMHSELVSSAKLRERFVQEAQIGARIHSDHVVEVIDAGVDESKGIPWLAMELLTGDTLADACAPDGLSEADVLSIFTQLGHAVAAAHEGGIVHRDLKPENIFLATSKREDVPFTVKVLDFGIAKLLSDAHTRMTGAIGTPLYMPPEQMEAGRRIGPESDVWALGLIAFYMLTGRSFWLAGNEEHGNSMMVMREVTMLPIPLASQRAAELKVADSIPSWFDSWFGRCVHRDIAARFPSAREMRAAMPRAVDSDQRAATDVPAKPGLAGAGTRTIAAEPLVDTSEAPRAARSEGPTAPAVAETTLAWVYLDRLVIVNGTKLNGPCAVTGEASKERHVFSFSHRPGWSWCFAVIAALLLMYLPVLRLTRQQDDYLYIVVLVLAVASVAGFHATRRAVEVMLPIGFKVLRRRSVGTLLAGGAAIAGLAIVVVGSSAFVESLIIGLAVTALGFVVASLYRSPLRLVDVRRAKYLLVRGCSPEFLKHLPNGPMPPE